MTVSGTLVTLTDQWGCDLSSKLNAQSATNLARAAMSNGQRATFVWRYVSLDVDPATGHGVYPGDIDAAERDAILNAGLTLLLVQHVNYPGWYASALNGAGHGASAAAHAMMVEYPKGCHIACDLEGVASGDAPQQIMDYVNGWCRQVISAGYLPALYVGYSCGLTSKELWELPLVSRYWTDFGQRQVDNRGFCMVQESNGETVAGIKIDRDHAMPDKLGGCLVGMGKLSQ